MLLAVFRFLGEMLTFCVSFYDYVAGNQSARGVSKWHFRSLVTNHGSILAGSQSEFVVFLVSHFLKVERWSSVAHVT